MLTIIIGFIRSLFIKNDNNKVWGIIAYCGSCGSGKTLTMVHQLNKLRKKYGNSVYICTNFGYKYQDFEYKEWQQLTKNYDKPLIVAWDEIQTVLFSRNYQQFPIPLLTVLTQNRKNNGLQIHYTTQNFDFVDKVVRQLTNYVYQCRTFFGCCSVCRGYIGDTFRGAMSTKNERIPSIQYQHTKHLYESYDTYYLVDSAKKIKYDNSALNNIDSIYNERISVDVNVNEKRKK